MGFLKVVRDAAVDLLTTGMESGQNHVFRDNCEVLNLTKPK